MLDTVKKIKDDKKYEHAKKEFKKMIEELNMSMSGKNDLEVEKKKMLKEIVMKNNDISSLKKELEFSKSENV